MTPPLHAWTVVLQWDCGRMSINTMLAPTPESAAAMTAAGSMRDDNAPTGNLVCCNVTPIDAEWLRWAARSIDEGKPASAEVVSMQLVRSPPEYAGTPYCVTSHLAPNDPAA